MKKRILTVAAALSFAGCLFAYNPPAGGQNVQRLSSPFLLSNANSAAGGALEEIIPSFIVNNPALTAYEQRIVVDAGGTFLIDKNDDDGDMGAAFQAGLLVPSRWCVVTFLGQGVFSPLIDMHVMDSLSFTGDVSKDITDVVSVGLGATFGYFWGHGYTDWSGAAHVGAYFKLGDIGALKDVRLGAAVMNLGKMYSKETHVLGIDRSEESEDWPGIATPKVGVAASLVDTGDFKWGCSVDVAVPAFQNVVFNAGIAIAYKDFITIASGWEYDVREYAEERHNILPSVMVGCKFRFNAKKGSTLAEHGWEESDMTVAAGWKQLYEDINAFSAGMVLKLGLEDREPPVITLWGDN